MNYPHLAARIFNTPLLIHPQKLDAIIAGLGERLLGFAIPDSRGPALLAPELFSTRRGERSERGYRVVDGVAVLGIHGVLVHRSRMEADSSFLLGYNDLATDLEDAMANPDVHAVLQVYDSPGGEAQGAFEYAQRVFDARGRKPLVAIADGMALSAAYLGASAADELAVTTSGHVGSIGVVLRHIDLSRALANDGVTVSHIIAGAHKVDGNPFEPLPPGVRADFQAEVDELYRMFVEAVALHRRVAPDGVRRTEAATYRAPGAMAAHLADRIATTDQLIAELAALRARSFPVPAPQGAPMSAVTTEVTTTFTQEDIDRATAQGREVGRNEGALAERERVAGILTHAAAAEHTPLAIQCITSGLSVEQAAAILSAAPTPAATQGNAFSAVMRTLGNPDVSGIEARADAASEEAEEAQLAGQVIALFRGAAH